MATENALQKVTASTSPALGPKKGMPSVRATSHRRTAREGHVWSYDFVKARTSDGRAVRLLTMIDEFSRECLSSPATVPPGRRR